MATKHELSIKGAVTGDEIEAGIAALDGLGRDDSLVIRASEEPRALHDALRAGRPGIFAWIERATGPWEIEVVRLGPIGEETVIGRFFARDHQQLDVTFEQLRRDLKARLAGQPIGLERIRDLFARFHAGLDLHIRWEEEVLFPAVEEHGPHLAHGPGQVMRAEHREIREALAAAGERFARPEPTPDDLKVAARELQVALDVLSDHNAKEEQIYYPMADQMIDPEAARRLLDRVRAMH